MKPIVQALTVAAVLLIMTAPTFAASNPANATETSSTGSADIQVVVPVLWKISNINDLDLGSYNGSDATIADDDPVCVYSNHATLRTYQVTLTPAHTAVAACKPAAAGCEAAARFGVANVANDQAIAYTAYWNDANTPSILAGDRVGVKGGAAATLTAQANASVEVDCTPEGGTNANFNVVMDKADLLAVEAGTYTGTLTIMVEPTA